MKQMNASNNPPWSVCARPVDDRLIYRLLQVGKPWLPMGFKWTRPVVAYYRVQDEIDVLFETNSHTIGLDGVTGEKP